MSQPVSDLEHNKAIVRRYKGCQGTKDEGAAVREILAPGYVRLRRGLEHLANDARDQALGADLKLTPLAGTWEAVGRSGAAQFKT